MHESLSKLLQCRCIYHLVLWLIEGSRMLSASGRFGQITPQASNPTQNSLKNLASDLSVIFPLPSAKHGIIFIHLYRFILLDRIGSRRT